MYIIIVGCGRLGTELALSLAADGSDVVVVDSDEVRFASLGSGFNGVTVAGIPFDEDVLERAGIVGADAVAAVTSDDNVNVMVSQMARRLYGVGRVLTRINAPDKVETFREMGFTVLCPTAAAAALSRRMLTGGDAQ